MEKSLDDKICCPKCKKVITTKLDPNEKFDPCDQKVGLSINPSVKSKMK